MKRFAGKSLGLIIGHLLAGIVIPPARYFSDILMPPYTVSENTVLSFSYVGNKAESTTITATLTNKTNTRVPIYQYVTAMASASFVGSFTILGTWLADANVTLYLTASGNGFSASKSFTLFARSASVVQPATEEGSLQFTASGKLTIVDMQGTVSYATEKWIFNGFRSIREDPLYHYLNLKDMTFSYTCTHALISAKETKATLYLLERVNLFPNIPLDSLGDARMLHGTFTLSTDGLYHFALTDALFVDPETLTMSTTYRPGYQATTYLYLPKNHFSQGQTFSFEIDTEPMGYNDVVFRYYGTFLADHPFFGDCSNAGYCLVSDDDPLTVGYDYTEGVTIGA